MTGVTAIKSWVQQGDATMNVCTTSRVHDTLRVSVTGTYTWGASVAVSGVSIPAGITQNDTWQKDFIFS
jgi:hypothetical protein